MGIRREAAEHNLTSTRLAKNEDLPQWPERGDRRRLERKWLALLEERGLREFLPEEPEDRPSELLEAIEQFNAGEYWDCHETLEGIWLKTPYPLRFFYPSIIKTAVGFHHIGRHNRHGGRVKLGDGVRLLGIFQLHYMGVDTAHLLDDASRWLTRVEHDDAPDWASLDKLPKPRIALLP